MSVFGPSGIAGAPLTEVKPGESWVANAPLVTDALAEPEPTDEGFCRVYNARKQPDELALTPEVLNAVVDALLERDAQAFVGSLS